MGFWEDIFALALYTIVWSLLKPLEVYEKEMEDQQMWTFQRWEYFCRMKSRVLYISFTTDKNLKTLGNPMAFLWRFLLLRHKELKCGFLINFWSVKDNISKVYLAKDDVSLKDKRKNLKWFQRNVLEHSGFPRHKPPLSGKVAMRMYCFCLLMHTFMRLDFLQLAVKHKMIKINCFSKIACKRPLINLNYSYPLMQSSYGKLHGA